MLRKSHSFEKSARPSLKRFVGINAITASQTNVTGTAALNGATVQVIDDKDITKRRVYTLLTASGGIVGTFNPDVVGVKNKVDLFYDANHVYLCESFA